MTISIFLGYAVALIAMVAAVYVALSRDLLRVTIAFFIEVACVGGVLLDLNAEYLAIVVFLVGVLGTVLVVSFSSVILGSLKESFRRELQTRSQRMTQLFGVTLGLGVSTAMGFILISSAFLKPQVSMMMIGDARVFGQMFLGEQLVVFEILSIIILGVIIGTALLLRKPSNDAL